jgi:hypothetical protein
MNSEKICVDTGGLHLLVNMPATSELDWEET